MVNLCVIFPFMFDLSTKIHTVIVTKISLHSDDISQIVLISLYICKQDEERYMNMQYRIVHVGSQRIFIFGG